MVILQLSFHVIFWKIFSEYKQWVYSSYNSTILSTDGSSTWLLIGNVLDT